MHFDDRLATVLRHRASGERAARTQFRQLLDLLGSRRHGRDESLLAAAWLRLAALGESLPPAERAAMIREPGLRFRNPELALHLAEDEPEVAAAALGVAHLAADDWEALVPRLPIRARGFLRLRRDLPGSTQDLLERLGVRDRGLPRPAATADAEPEPLELEVEAPTPRRPIPANDLADEVPATGASAPDQSEIAALVRRIETFRKNRAGRPAGEESPRLPLGERTDGSAIGPRGFAFTTDAEGRIDWADARVAPMVIGMALTVGGEEARRHQPLKAATFTAEGAPAIAGDWIIDAAPRFSDPGGRFIGYAGRFRRPAPAEAAGAGVNPATDRMRQLLHELKTPVNAIQGFAEVIQQQLFGPTPHEYRALAAAIAGDAARMLAGFDELDRLARLESGALVPDAGTADWTRIVGGLAEQIGDAVRQRGARFELTLPDRPSKIALDAHDAEVLGWRLLATLAGAANANETLRLALDDAAGMTRLEIALPASLAMLEEVFEADTRAGGGALSAGMFGAGFALRLARAEARAIGGDLVRDGEALVLTLPSLTGSLRDSSPLQADAASG